MRLLLICRHYPPAVAGGARRPYQLAHGLAQAGAEVTLVAPDADPDLPSIAVPHPHRDPEPDTGAPPSLSGSVRNAVREWAYWPDPDIKWALQAAKIVREQYDGRPDWILSTSPPESVHVAAGSLKSHFAARWAADFRDHWFKRAFRRYRRYPLRRMVEERLATHWLRNVDLLIGVNDQIVSEAATLAPHVAPERQLVLSHFSTSMPGAASFSTPGPHLVHTGSFSLSDPKCSIAPLLSAFEQASIARAGLRLHLFGRLSAEETDAVSASRARKSIEIHGVVPREEALAWQQAADALIVVAAESALAPPGKLSEYYSAKRPVIALGRPEWTQPASLGTGDIASAAKAMTAPETLPLTSPASLLDTATAATRLLNAMGSIAD